MNSIVDEGIDTPFGWLIKFACESFGWYFADFALFSSQYQTHIFVLGQSALFICYFCFLAMNYIFVISLLDVGGIACSVSLSFFRFSWDSFLRHKGSFVWFEGWVLIFFDLDAHSIADRFRFSVQIWGIVVFLLLFNYIDLIIFLKTIFVIFFIIRLSDFRLEVMSNLSLVRALYFSDGLVFADLRVWWYFLLILS